MKLALDKNKTDKLLFWIAMFIMATGIIVRLVVLIQNRNLIIDECNIARNIYERGFAGLMKPLNYEQYAPPVFLWILKLFTNMFGMSEPVLRLYAFLSSIGATVMMYLVLRQFTSLRSLWYPLVLFAIAHIMIRYSTEAKQYMADVFVILLLIWSALKIKIETTPWYKFLLLWLLFGSVAIWASMPSVFMLSGVGLYYGYTCLQQKNYPKLSLIILVAVLWLLQFLLYYYTILKPQIQSDYLQQFHKDYFLYVIPHGFLEWKHNYHVLADLLEAAGGYHALAVIFHTLLIVTAVVVLLYKHTARGLLLVTPLVAVVVAAMAHQFSLLSRVALFTLPLLLILIGYGFELFMNVRFAAWRFIMLVVTMICIVNHNSASKMIRKPFSTEDFTAGLRFFKKEHISGRELYIHNGSRPALIYYTQIHPDKEEWAQFSDAHLLNWDANYDEIAGNATGRIGLIITSVYPDELARIRNAMEAHLTVVAKLDDQEKHRVYAYVYQKK